ncbi:hypothetical protein HPB47_014525, partial [Ixodes persulcatus]
STPFVGKNGRRTSSEKTKFSTKPVSCVPVTLMNATYKKTFKREINVELVELDRVQPVLIDEAIPTIFPDAPSYLTRPVPKKRKERNLADRGTPPLKRWAASGSTHDRDPGNARTEPAPETHPFTDILPPSMYCSRIVLSNDPTALCFGWHARMEPDHVCV